MKQWTNPAPIVFTSADDVVPIDIGGVKLYLSLKPPAPGEAKQDFEASGRAILGHRDFVMPDVTSDALAKRVEALERDDLERASLCEVMANGIQGNRERLSALEAKLTKLDADDDDLVQKYNALARSIEGMRTQLAALEASKAQPVVNVADLHNDMAKLAQPMSLGAVAWPKGSLQWADLEAKRRGLRCVQRASGNGNWGRRAIRNMELETFTDEDRHALNWEPCA